MSNIIACLPQTKHLYLFTRLVEVPMLSTTYFLPAERAEEATINAHRAQLANEGQLNMIMQAMPDVAAIMNEERQFVYGNQKLLTFLGFGRVEDLGSLRMGEALGCKNAFDHEGGCGTGEYCRYCGAAQAMQQAMQKGERVAKECRIATHTADGPGSLELLVTVSPFPFMGRKYYILALADISDTKRRQMLEKIFFHDIINLAGGLQSLMEILKTTPGIDNDLHEYITMADRVSHELLDEIMAQRALVAAENGELQPQVNSVDTLQLLDEVQAFFAHHSISDGKKIVVSAQAVHERMATDKTLLRRVITNMVKNALEACKPKDTVTLCCNWSNGRLLFQVHNPGHIPKAIQAQIFQRSFSTRGQNRGLGTYSIKLLTERYLRGEVGFLSNEVSGTMFFAALPVEVP